MTRLLITLFLVGAALWSLGVFAQVAFEHHQSRRARAKRRASSPQAVLAKAVADRDERTRLLEQAS